MTNTEATIRESTYCPDFSLYIICWSHRHTVNFYGPSVRTLKLLYYTEPTHRFCGFSKKYLPNVIRDLRGSIKHLINIPNPLQLSLYLLSEYQLLIGLLLRPGSLGKITGAAGEHARGTARWAASESDALPLGVRLGDIAPPDNHSRKSCRSALVCFFTLLFCLW